MHRRQACRLIWRLSALPLLACPVRAAAQAGADKTLSLYGVPLKNAAADTFLAAAQAAGGTPLPVAPGAPPQLDMRAAGVPALEALTVISQDGRVAVIRFRVKGYGQDNVQLRGLLLGKYGVPMTVSPRPLPYPSFAERVVPRGAFQWLFEDGMKLVYEHPRVGEVSLSYVDESLMPQSGGSGRRPAPRVDDSVQDRF